MSRQELARREDRTMTVPAERREPRFTPQADIVEDAEKIQIHLDLPGVESKDVEVALEHGLLTVFGRVEPRQPAGTRYGLREYEVGSFARQFEIGDAVDRSRIEATCADGVVTLTLPKVERARPRRIEVRGK
jgi:HSP20 family protein